MQNSSDSVEAQLDFAGECQLEEEQTDGASDAYYQLVIVCLLDRYRLAYLRHPNNLPGLACDKYAGSDKVFRHLARLQLSPVPTGYVLRCTDQPEGTTISNRTSGNGTRQHSAGKDNNCKHGDKPCGTELSYSHGIPPECDFLVDHSTTKCQQKSFTAKSY
jgi:hypothetical protein